MENNLNKIIGQTPDQLSKIWDLNKNPPLPKIESLNNLKEYLEKQTKVMLNPTKPKIEKFIVKHYSNDSHPTIKGNGFDGLVVGEDREEAEEFINFINELIGE